MDTVFEHIRILKKSDDNDCNIKPSLSRLTKITKTVTNNITRIVNGPITYRDGALWDGSLLYSAS